MKGIGNFITLIVLAAIGLVIGVSVILSTAPTIIAQSATGATTGLENLSSTGKTVVSFVPLLYIIIPLVIIGGVIAGFAVAGKKLLGGN